MIELDSMDIIPLQGLYPESEHMVVELIPFRYMKGLQLLAELSSAQHRRMESVYLMDQLDIATRSLAQLMGIPAFSCVRRFQ